MPESIKEETYYNYRSLSFSIIKSITLAPSTEAKTVKNDRNKCNNVPWLYWAI